jgi:hypothetical protein
VTDTSTRSAPETPSEKRRRGHAQQSFRERDVTRLIRAARKAGVELNRVSVDPRTGKIIATFGTPEDGQVLSTNGHADENQWDEVLGHGNDQTQAR